MEKIDFEKVAPFYQNDVTRWYIDEKLQKYIGTEQRDNLPILDCFYAFAVIGDGISDYVLIDGNQNIFGTYRYTHEGYEQMIAKINFLKIDKHFDEYEKANV